MKLNPDCVRDILITAEDICDYDTPWVYNIHMEYEHLKKYPIGEVQYHLSQCEKSDLIEITNTFEDGETIYVSDLTPYGHQFLADIRSDNVWNNVKEVSKKVGSNSLNALIQISAGVISSIIKSQLKLS